MNFRFDQPLWLALALLAIPLIVIGWRALVGVDRLRAFFILGFRALLLLALAVLLAGPNTVQRNNDLTVIGVLDISGSVRRFADLPPASTLNPSALIDSSNIEFLRQWFRLAVKDKKPNDRFGLVVFDGAAAAVSAPTIGRYIDDNLDIPLADGTNIASGLQLAIAQQTPDSAHRIVLATDGNQTAGDALSTLRDALAATSAPNTRSQLPVDVLPISYNVPRDVAIDRIDAPPLAQPGQTVAVRITFQSSAPVTGRVSLRRENTSIDLNGPAPGASLPVSLPKGQYVLIVNVALGSTPVNRLRADFEPDNPADDVLPENNRADAFVATPSKGDVLIVDNAPNARSSALTSVLQEAQLPFSVINTDEFPEDLLSLQNFDLVILNNIPAHELPAAKQNLLATYVNDLGGGFIMLGGPHSFGPGGWNGTPIEALLPLQLDPPKNLVLPSAALVLILDKSGSMKQNVAGARATQQEIANEGAAMAIESLRHDSLVGVVTFDYSANELIPIQPNTDPKQLADIVRGIQPLGGTDLGPPLQLALEMLRPVKAARKRVVCLTDGRSEDRNLQPIAQQMADEGIQLTTIAVGDDADTDLLRELATIGHGEYTEVRNARRLPQILVESVQIINEPLVKEGAFSPKILPTASPLTLGLSSAPNLYGIVLTSPRPDAGLTTSVDLVGPDGTPLLAVGQAGLGKVAAFTSDLTGEWSRDWRAWSGYDPFVLQLVRSTSRPAMSQSAELFAEIKDNQLHVTYDVTDPSILSQYLSVTGYVYDPLGKPAPITLQQSAPGRFQSTLPAPLAGNYIVALNPRAGAQRLPSILGGASRPTSFEYRAEHSNTALLKEIAETTHGRLLDLLAPSAANLFDRSSLPPSIAILPAWKFVLWFALALLMLDIACRRIAWSAAGIRSLLSTLLARIAPARSRPAVAPVTIASYHNISARLETQHTADARGIEKLQGSSSLEIPPDHPLRDNLDLAANLATPTKPLRPAPDAAQVDLALKALREHTHPASDHASPPPAAPTSSPPPPPEAPQTTSNLLDAKRRIRDRMNRDPENR